MPKTPAEKMAEFHSRAKENDTFENFKQKEAARQGINRRLLKSLNCVNKNSVIIKQREQTKNRTAKWRERKQNSEKSKYSPELEPFLNNKCFTTAVRKVIKALPKKSRKSFAVLNQLENETSLPENNFSFEYVRRPKT
jgi:Zn-dependent M32 family carboxypeptidase